MKLSDRFNNITKYLLVLYTVANLYGLAPFKYTLNPPKFTLSRNSTFYSLAVLVFFTFFYFYNSLRITNKINTSVSNAPRRFADLSEVLYNLIGTWLCFLIHFFQRKNIVRLINELISISRSVENYKIKNISNKYFSKQFNIRMCWILLIFMIILILFLCSLNVFNSKISCAMWISMHMAHLIFISFYINLTTLIGWHFLNFINRQIFSLVTDILSVDEFNETLQKNLYRKQCNHFDQLCSLHMKFTVFLKNALNLFVFHIIFLTISFYWDLVTSVS